VGHFSQGLRIEFVENVSGVETPSFQPEETLYSLTYTVNDNGGFYLGFAFTVKKNRFCE